MKSHSLLAWEDFPSLPQWMIWAIQTQITFMIYTVPTWAQNQSLPLNHLAYLFSWQLNGQSNLSVRTPSFVFSADTRWKVQSQWQSLSLAGFWWRLQSLWVAWSWRKVLSFCIYLFFPWRPEVSSHPECTLSSVCGDKKPSKISARRNLIQTKVG